MDKDVVLQIRLLEDRIKGLYPAKDGYGQLVQVRQMGWKEKQLLRTLLDTRKDLLDSIFRQTPKEMERLADVNGRLLDLSERLMSRTLDIYSSVLKAGYDPGFDDDVMIEGKLRFLSDLYEDDDTVLPVEGDEEYGSDFKWMLGFICELDGNEEYYPCVRTINSCRTGHPLEKEQDYIAPQTGCDDGVSWDHSGRFGDICMCHALYSLHSNNLFSYPDILHMNGFWCEVKVLHQLITDLKGNRSSHMWEQDDLL